jgi:hypothetical protein
LLEREKTPPPDLPEGEYLVHLALRGDVLEVHTEESQLEQA